MQQPSHPVILSGDGLPSKSKDLYIKKHLPTTVTLSERSESNGYNLLRSSLGKLVITKIKAPRRFRLQKLKNSKPRRPANSQLASLKQCDLQPVSLGLNFTSFFQTESLLELLFYAHVQYRKKYNPIAETTMMKIVTLREEIYFQVERV